MTMLFELILSFAVLVSCLAVAEDECARDDGAWAYVATPPLTKAALLEEWEQIDDEAMNMIANFRLHSSFSLFPHARDVFKNHLIGTFSILGQWGQGKDIRRTGLFHTGYSGDLFQFAKWNADKRADRDVLAGIIGKPSEELTFLFGTVTRGALVQLSQAMKDDIMPSSLTAGMLLSVPSRIEKHKGNTPNITVTAHQVGKLMVVTMADYLDQAVTVNGWRDHHQVEAPLKLYPGAMKPEISFYWLSKICKSVREVLDVIPPVFDDCQAILSREDEISARDMYWDVVVNEETLSVAEQEERLVKAINLNPFIAEPHLFRAQIAFRAGDYELSKREAKKCIEKFFKLGTAWDKRISFQTWVASARMLLLRSNRRSNGLTSLPYSSDQPPTSVGLPIVMLDDLMDAFHSQKCA